MLFTVLGALCAAFLLSKILSCFGRVQRGLATLGSCPGKYLLWTHPFDTVGLALLPLFPFSGYFGNFQVRFSYYARQDSTILSSVLIWSGTPIFWVADANALKVVTSDRSSFMKDLGNYDRVNIYGKSVVTTEGAEWRRHVAVAGPAFSEANYMLTWKETMRIMNDWFSVDFQSATDSVQTNVVKSMTQATLHVIASAGFGFRAPWAAFNRDNDSAAGFQSHPTEKSDSKNYGIFPFAHALQLTLDKLFWNVLVPDTVQKILLRRVNVPFVSGQIGIMKRAFASLEVHMRRLVDASRDGGEHKESDLDSGEKEDFAEADLLRRLVQANDIARKASSDGSENTPMKKALTEGELFSNIFIFLLAGHETSAHTLAYAILLMALYPEVQAKLREESLRVWPTPDDIESSSYKRDFEKFEYTLAFFRETLRCFPTEPRLVKLVTQDTVLQATRFKPENGTSVSTPVSSFDGNSANVCFTRNENAEEKFAVSLPKGSLVLMDIWGLHMNPLVWGSDAHIFRPERFIDTADYKWPRDGFMAFSAGARGCIGLRFAYAESICILAMLVRRFEILPAKGRERHTFATFEDMKRFMLKTWPELTITPVNGLVQLRPLSATQ